MWELSACKAIPEIIWRLNVHGKEKSHRTGYYSIPAWKGRTLEVKLAKETDGIYPQFQAKQNTFMLIIHVMSELNINHVL